MKNKNRAARIAGWIVLGIFMIALMGSITMYLWNWLVPGLFNGPEITFLQTLGLLLLVKIITGIGGMGRHRWGRHGHYSSHMWKQKWEQKMSGMSEEEKEKFKEMYYRRCGRSKSWMQGEKEESQTT